MGLPPGTLVHIGEKKTDKVRITLIEYDEGRFQEKDLATITDWIPVKNGSTVSWLDVGGIHQLDLIEQIGNKFDLHPLLLEDIVNTDQRPKLEEYGAYLYVVLKMLYVGDKRNQIVAEQVSIVHGPAFVLSFQENGGDVFNSVRDRLKTSKGLIRKLGADYLVYALVDAIVDSYFTILEGLGESVELLEEDLVANPTPRTLHGIHARKRDMLFLRRSVWPLREVISGLERGGSSLIQEPTKIYLRDVYDHTIQIMDTIETFRELVSGMLDIYLSSMSNKMTSVMKVLTIITAIFMPLTFIAGIYGMNFEFMPELRSRWGYPLVLLGMGVIGIAMLLYFKRKKWI
ncbi:MAG: magnesium/cobalt transporter CorA [Nitrospiraceae bacterium]